MRIKCEQLRHPHDISQINFIIIEQITSFQNPVTAY